jgi:hypothetical protein
MFDSEAGAPCACGRWMLVSLGMCAQVGAYALLLYFCGEKD